MLTGASVADGRISRFHADSALRLVDLHSLAVPIVKPEGSPAKVTLTVTQR